MSGSSYSRSSFSGATFGTESDSDCSQLAMNTKVISPTMSYFGGVSIGTVLSVSLDNSIVVLLDAVGNSVGSIYPTRVERLKKCLEDGFEYEAKIIAINGASIEVSIKPI